MKIKQNGNCKTLEEFIKQSKNGSLEDFLSIDKEYNIKNLDLVTETIMNSIKNKETISIIGDYDVDGITATAILYLALKEKNAKVNFRLPKRITEGYGLSEKIVDEIEDGLLITVDNGIVAFDAIQKAKEKGLSVIVTDHHLPSEDGMLPNADIIIDPHIEGTSDFSDYCGAGIAYKLAEKLIDNKDLLKQLESLACIGTICDVMPLVEENRKIVANGLSYLSEKNTTKGIQTLLDKTNLKDYINTSDIGFRIGPILNSPGRLEDNGAMKALTLITKNNNSEQEDIDNKVQELLEYNNQRKQIVSDCMNKIEQNFATIYFDHYLNIIEDMKFLSKPIPNIVCNNGEILDFQILSESDNTFDLQKNESFQFDELELYEKFDGFSEYYYDSVPKNVIEKLLKEKGNISLTKTFGIKETDIVEDYPIIIYEPNIPEGIVGILAGRLAEKYNAPSFVFTDSYEKGYIKGSARTACDLNIKELLDKYKDEFIKYGGHKEAAGILLKKENFGHIKEILQQDCFRPFDSYKSDEITYDIEIEAKDIPNVLEEMQKYMPFGEGNPEPIFYIKNFSAKKVSQLGKDLNHVKFKNNNYSAIGFNMDKQFQQIKCPKTLNFVGKLSYNYYKDNKTPQVNIEYMEPRNRTREKQKEDNIK